MPSVQSLLSLPPAMAGFISQSARFRMRDWFATSDPPGGKLGSGGGIAHLLAEAYETTGQGQPFESWVRTTGKLLLLAGGQSRRLPAYASTGKLFIPMPVLRWAAGQSLDQTLLDLQQPAYARTLHSAMPHYCALVTSGDVLLRYEPLMSPLPRVDVLGLGMWVRPEVATHFGVFFSPREAPGEWKFFRQKPSASDIRELAAEHLYLVDTGMWLLSEHAVHVLMTCCGWTGTRFKNNAPDFFELYSEFGLALGSHPTRCDPRISQLTSAIVPLPDAEFYHLGTNRQLIESVSALQNLQLDQTKLAGLASRPHPDQFILNSSFSHPRRLDRNHTLWVENSCIPHSWQLQSHHVLTGVPHNTWSLALERSVCLDFTPIAHDSFCIRAYGFDDSFRGRLDASETLWFGRPAADWFTQRNIQPERPESDMQQAALFPVLPLEKMTAAFVQWMFAEKPESSPVHREQWQAAERLSAEQICDRAHIDRLLDQRERNLHWCLPRMAANYRWNAFYRLDLENTAAHYAASEADLPQPVDNASPITRINDAMFRSEVLAHRNLGSEADRSKRVAFELLAATVVERMVPVTPRRAVLEDQIIWGRSPVRIDLAGGWSDTPPYCINHGGRVVNMAINLNGQPPVQVFARCCEARELVVRSIDLGLETRIRTFEELHCFDPHQSSFALAKAAFALAGFLPQFNAHCASSLSQQLADFGGGIEISLLAAVPKGSGLGTSSILSATLLGVLSELCGLHWDQAEICNRTLALEQLLTTGGGWQDQVGGISRGIKLIETAPGFEQQPMLRWLPDHLFADNYANRTALLYYTGITRMAKDILHDIVRGMFLNNGRTLGILGEISQNALITWQAVQAGDWTRLCQAVDTTWQLNQALDAGTNPPAVQAILSPLKDWLAAAKLPGAGGGGYLLMLAKDDDAAQRIRQYLMRNPPNARARFVDMTLSHLGLQITRS